MKWSRNLRKWKEVFVRKLEVEDTVNHLHICELSLGTTSDTLGILEQDYKPANVECIRASLDAKSRQMSLKLPI